MSHNLDDMSDGSSTHGMNHRNRPKLTGTPSHQMPRLTQNEGGGKSLVMDDEEGIFSPKSMKSNKSSRHGSNHGSNHGSPIQEFFEGNRPNIMRRSGHKPSLMSHNSANDFDVEDVEDFDDDEVDDNEFDADNEEAKVLSSRQPVFHLGQDEEDEVVSEDGDENYENTSEMSNIEDNDEESLNTQESRYLKFEEKQKLKRLYIKKLRKFAKYGFYPSRNVESYNMSSSYTELKMEYDFVKDDFYRDKIVKKYMKRLTTGIGVIEFGNKMFDPAGVDLDGFSEYVLSDTAEYEDIFERMYEKNGPGEDSDPRFDLVVALFTSVVSFWITKNVNKGGMNFDDILRQSPEIQKEIERNATSALNEINAAERGGNIGQPRHSMPNPFSRTRHGGGGGTMDDIANAMQQNTTSTAMPTRVPGM
jgi:hypothetical protein